MTLPLLFRRTWPRVRAEILRLRDAEGMTPSATAELQTRRAIDAARAAAVHSPWFRRRYSGLGPIETPEDFRRLPVVTKDDVREHVEEMVRDDADRSALQRGATGGSTGVPTPYYHDEAWWVRASAVAMRGDQWAGWRIGEPHAALWGTPLSETRRARWIRRAGEIGRNQVFLPGADLSDANVDRNLAVLRRRRPRLVTGYASILLAHARRAAERGVSLPPPRAVVSSAETLRPEARAEIEDAFGAPVVDRYGCRELGMIAQECSVRDGLHVATEHVHVEIDVDGRPARPGESGRVLVTLLGEPAFPFVRYEVGDSAVAGDGEPCLCGVPSARLARIEGRLLDVLRRADGGAITGVFFPHLVKEFPFVKEFQVFQDETGAVDLRIVPVAGADRGPATALLAEARRALGGLPVRMEFVEALERTPSGKVPVTRSRWKGPVAAPAGARS